MSARLPMVPLFSSLEIFGTIACEPIYSTIIGRLSIVQLSANSASYGTTALSASPKILGTNVFYGTVVGRIGMVPLSASLYMVPLSVRL